VAASDPFRTFRFQGLGMNPLTTVRGAKWTCRCAVRAPVL